MYDAIDATSYASSLYFMTLITFGNYILSNLFIAILLDSFSERAEEEERALINGMRAKAKKNPEAIKRLANVRRQMQADNTGYLFGMWKALWDNRVQRMRQVTCTSASLTLTAVPDIDCSGAGCLCPY